MDHHDKQRLSMEVRLIDDLSILVKQLNCDEIELVRNRTISYFYRLLLLIRIYDYSVYLFLYKLEFLDKPINKIEISIQSLELVIQKREL